MRMDMRGFLTQPVPRKGGTVKCFIRREKRELVCRRLHAMVLFFGGERGGTLILEPLFLLPTTIYVSSVLHS